MLIVIYYRTCIPEKTKSILKCLIRSSNYLKMTEVKQIIQYCFPHNKEFYVNISKAIHEMAQLNNFSGYKRHPIILVIDEV